MGASETGNVRSRRCREGAHWDCGGIIVSRGYSVDGEEIRCPCRCHSERSDGPIPLSAAKEPTPGPWIYRGPATIGGPCIMARRGEMEVVVATVTTSEIWYGGVGEFISKETEADANARLIAAAPALKEALDNATASLETCLTHFGKYMPEADRIGRAKVIHEARALLARIEGHS